MQCFLYKFCFETDCIAQPVSIWALYFVNFSVENGQFRFLAQHSLKLELILVPSFRTVECAIVSLSLIWTLVWSCCHSESEHWQDWIDFVVDSAHRYAWLKMFIYPAPCLYRSHISAVGTETLTRLYTYQPLPKWLEVSDPKGTWTVTELS